MKLRLPTPPTTDDGPDSPIAALIDVAFLMLIFFLVSTTLLKQEQELAERIPPPGHPTPSVVLPVEIRIDDNGAITLGGGTRPEPVEPPGTGRISPALHDRLAPMLLVGGPEPPPVLLDVADGASHQRAVSVLDCLAGLEIVQIHMVDAAAQ